MSETDELRGKLRAVANLRRDYDKIHAEYKAKSEEVYKQVADLAHMDEAAKNALADAEKELRELAERHGDCGLPGIQVVQATVYDYDEELALAWVVDHGMLGALKLNRKAFEKLAAAANPPCVKIYKEPKAKIASDLAEHGYLEEE